MEEPLYLEPELRIHNYLVYPNMQMVEIMKEHTNLTYAAH